MSTFVTVGCFPFPPPTSHALSLNPASAPCMRLLQNLTDSYLCCHQRKFARLLPRVNTVVLIEVIYTKHSGIWEKQVAKHDLVPASSSCSEAAETHFLPAASPQNYDVPQIADVTNKTLTLESSQPFAWLFALKTRNFSATNPSCCNVRNTSSQPSPHPHRGPALLLFQHRHHRTFTSHAHPTLCTKVYFHPAPCTLQKCSTGNSFVTPKTAQNNQLDSEPNGTYSGSRGPDTQTPPPPSPTSLWHAL